MADPKTSIEIARKYDHRWNHADTFGQAALGILHDCLDRRGIKHEFANVDDDIMDDILDAWAEIIKTVVENPSASQERSDGR